MMYDKLAEVTAEMVAYTVATELVKKFSKIPFELRKNKDLNYQVLRDILGEGFNYEEFVFDSKLLAKNRNL